FIDRVAHKLRGYLWNLAESYACDLVFVVTEIDAGLATRTVRFRLQNAFTAEEIGRGRLAGGGVHNGAALLVATAVLRHGAPVLGFALEEAAHVNVWKNRLDERGLPVGPWLSALKRAVVEGRPDDAPIQIAPAHAMPLGDLRDLVTLTPGQKVAYVTDVA